MEITQLPPTAPILSRIMSEIRTTVTKDRPTIHLSDLTLCLRKAYFRKKKLAPLPSEQQCLLYITGLSFQQFMYPYEETTITIDGIDCTPDICIPNTEIKSVRQSIGKFNFEEMTHWKSQIFGYMKALGTLDFDLVVLFLMGNWRPPFPQLIGYHIKATEEEVFHNWKILQEKKEILAKCLETNTPPPDSYCAPWEYQYCECIELCPDTVCYKKKLITPRKEEE